MIEIRLEMCDYTTWRATVLVGPIFPALVGYGNSPSRALQDLVEAIATKQHQLIEEWRDRT